MTRTYQWQVKANDVNLLGKNVHTIKITQMSDIVFLPSTANISSNTTNCLLRAYYATMIIRISCPQTFQKPMATSKFSVPEFLYEASSRQRTHQINFSQPADLVPGVCRPHVLYQNSPSHTLHIKGQCIHYSDHIHNTKVNYT
jgi:hypothetical protein